MQKVNAGLAAVFAYAAVVAVLSELDGIFTLKGEQKMVLEEFER